MNGGNNPLYPRPLGLDTTLAALNADKETTQEAERVSWIGHPF